MLSQACHEITVVSTPIHFTELISSDKLIAFSYFTPSEFLRVINYACVELNSLNIACFKRWLILINNIYTGNISLNSFGMVENKEL